jgi:hypothetical protein
MATGHCLRDICDCPRCTKALDAVSDFGYAKLSADLAAIVSRPSSRVRSPVAVRPNTGAGSRSSSRTTPEGGSYKELRHCPLCGAGVRPARINRHLEERCPERPLKGLTNAVDAVAQPTLTIQEHPKLPQEKSRRVRPEKTHARNTDLQRLRKQAYFERGFLQGGLCSGR